jgi:hypothetical protein
MHAHRFAFVSFEHGSNRELHRRMGSPLRPTRTTYHIGESAHPDMPDILGARFIRRDVPQAHIYSASKPPLFDHLVGAAMQGRRLRDCAALACTASPQFRASESTRPSQPFGGRTLRMKAMVRARSTTSESPYFPRLIQFGPYMANGTFVSYDHGDPWVEA